MMQSYPVGDLIVTLNKEGVTEFSKVSFPARYGRFSEIQTPDYTFQFNLNGEIKYIQGRTQNWPHPAEWLKRTVANDWVYYSAGDYKGVYELFGEYYFPCLSYPSNVLLDDDPFEKEAIQSAIGSWRSMPETIRELIQGDLPQECKDFLTLVTGNSEKALRLRSETLHRLIEGQVPVLPPDTRHVDYEVIPILVADGCLYHCGFCRIKTGESFSPRTPIDIIQQMKNLKRFYAKDLHNYNAIFLGQHDALWVGQDLLEFAAQKAYEIFELGHSFLKDARLFLFGSVDSLIHSKEALFDMLNRLPFFTYVNIGLESADLTTLAVLKKPVAVEKVREAFSRMSEINRDYEKVEITANFIYGEDLPPNHLPAFLQLLQDSKDLFRHKGTLYLSPLVQSESRKKGTKRELLRRFYKVKAQSPLPVYIYLIQRL